MLMGQVVHEGWLKKSPSHWSFWNKQWKRRYFVLCSGHMPGQCCLQYFKDQTKKNLKGTINLQDCEQVDAYLTYESKNQKLKYDWIFDIRLLNGKVLFMAAESEDLMNDWVNIICTVCSLQKEDEQNHNGIHDHLDDHHTLVEPSFDNPSRSSSFDSNFSPSVNGVGSNGSGMLSAVPVVNKTISVNGGEINMTSRQGYIPLTDCMSGPARPRNLFQPTTTSDHAFDDFAPAVPPPPLPADAVPKKSSFDSNWDSNVLRPAIVVHSRAASNDSTTSSNNMQMSSDSDIAPSTPLPNGSSASLNLSEDPSGDDSLSPRNRRPSDILNAVAPPPRPPKPRRNCPIAKEPNLHTPYRNNIVVEEDPFPSTYDRPAYSHSSLQRPATGRQPSSPILSLSSTPGSHLEQFNSLPRLHSSDGNNDVPSMLASLNVNSNGTSSNGLNGETSNSTLYSSVKPPVPVENYQNIALSPPPRQNSHHSPSATDKPPEIDRSLKPSRNRNRSSESTSPTMVNAPAVPVVQIHEQQPHIPPRLPDKKKLPSVSNYYQDPHYDRPMIGVTRKASFTKKSVQNNPLTHKRPSDTQDTPPPEKQIVYVEMDMPPAAIGPLASGSGSFSSLTRPSTNGGDHHHTNNNSMTPPAETAASAAKHSYVIINHDKTKALEITKTEQDKMYKVGTFERSQSKASVMSSHK